MVQVLATKIVISTAMRRMKIIMKISLHLRQTASRLVGKQSIYMSRHVLILEVCSSSNFRSVWHKLVQIWCRIQKKYQYQEPMVSSQCTDTFVVQRTCHGDQARVENVGSDDRVKIPWFYATIHIYRPMYSQRVAPNSKSFSAANARADGSATIKISVAQ